MATTKITITLPDDQIDEIRSLILARGAANVSAFVKRAVGVALSDAAWREMLNDALRQTGGPLTTKERAWADAILAPRGRGVLERQKERRLNGVTLDAGRLIVLERSRIAFAPIRNFAVLRQ